MEAVVAVTCAFGSNLMVMAEDQTSFHLVTLEVHSSSFDQGSFQEDNSFLLAEDALGVDEVIVVAFVEMVIP